MSKTIALIEDDDALRELYKERLEIDGIEVIEARDGQKGLEMILEKLPAAVLLDLNLPRMSGKDILEKIKADEKAQHIPVIILTAITDKVIVKECIDKGAEKVLIKPFTTPKEVVASIKNFIA